MILRQHILCRCSRLAAFPDPHDECLKLSASAFCLSSHSPLGGLGGASMYILQSNLFEMHVSHTDLFTKTSRLLVHLLTSPILKHAPFIRSHPRGSSHIHVRSIQHLSFGSRLSGFYRLINVLLQNINVRFNVTLLRFLPPLHSHILKRPSNKKKCHQNTPPVGHRSDLICCTFVY